MKARGFAVTVLSALGTAGFGLFGASFGGCAIQLQASDAATSGFSGTAAASGAGGAFSGAGGGGGGSVDNPLGRACSADADCGGSLTCLTASGNDPLFGGGPVGGFCTKTCDADADCPGPSACLKHSDAQPGRCVPTCEIGPPLKDLTQPLNPSKCGGREDLRCARYKTVDVCLPTCGKDDQCGKGRSCDSHLSVCVEMPAQGLPTGSACEQNQHPSPCAGACIGFSSGQAMCSSPCVLGGDGPGSDDCGGPALGLCAFRPPQNGAGDVGYCTPSCVQQSDCQNPTFWCFSTAVFTESTGKGYCFAPLPCPKGQGDCVDAEKNPLPYTCTETPAGKLCLDTTYPLPLVPDAGPDADLGDADLGDADLGDAYPQDADLPDAGLPDADLDGGADLDAGAGGGDAGP